MTGTSSQLTAGDAQTCPICLNSMHLTRNVAITPCGHAFCFQCMVDMVYTQAGAKCPCCRQNIAIAPSPGLVHTRVSAPRRVLPPSLAAPPPTAYEPNFKTSGTREWFVDKFGSTSELPPPSISPEDLVLGHGNRTVFAFAKLLDAFPYPNRLRLSLRELFAEFRRWLLSVPRDRPDRATRGLTMGQFEAELFVLGFSATTTRGIGLSLNRRVKGYNLFIDGSVEIL